MIDEKMSYVILQSAHITLLHIPGTYMFYILFHITFVYIFTSHLLYSIDSFLLYNRPISYYTFYIYHYKFGQV